MPDGRSERKRRSRDAIVDALLNLHSDGILVPTAQEVADRSGLGIRTVFRHFNEMEDLFATGDTVLHERIGAKPQLSPSGNYLKRCQNLIENRTTVCAQIRPYLLASNAQSWKYKVLRTNYRKLCNMFRERMLEFIPELKDEPKQTADTAEMLLSFETWNRLRHVQKLSQKETKQIMLASLRAVMNR